MQKNRLLPILFFFFSILLTLNIKAQKFTIILGRPTDSLVTASIAFDQNVEYYFEYGKQSGNYTSISSTYTNMANTPDERDIDKLLPNTRYYYRLRYRLIGATSYLASSEYSFFTQRSKGSTFSFTIEADEHLYDKKGVDNMYRITLANQAKDKPDFMLSLGDIFGDDHYPTTITSQQLDVLHNNYRPFLGAICHSIPFYVCLGNHEGENDYFKAMNPPNNLAIWATLWRKNYYPNPFPNGFYSGNTEKEPFGVDYPENYYAWTWGDAQFIVLDVYRDQCDTSEKPQGWNWSLGLPQYTWLKNTLESSTSKYKFVFAHHIRGQGRGGVTNAQLYEWGGLNKLGGANTFANNRPGWAKPIHQLFIDNKVNIFFQGHDHVFAHEMLDSITYQAVPMAADSTYEIGMLANADSYVSDTVVGTGHLRVTVSPENVKVDFVRTYLPADTLGTHKNAEIAFSYTIGSVKVSAVNELIEADKVIIYPNPSSDLINVSLPANIEKQQLNLYNTIGQLVSNSQTQLLDVSALPNGVYILSVETSIGSVNKRVIINK